MKPEEIHKNLLNMLTWLANKTAELHQYHKVWSAEFCMEQHSEFFEKAKEHIGVVDFTQFTKDQLLELRFGVWDDSGLMLFPTWAWDFIKEGTMVTDINGDTLEFKSHLIDNEIRHGCFAFGIYPADNGWAE